MQSEENACMAEAKNLEEAIRRCEDTAGKIASVLGIVSPSRVEDKLPEPLTRLGACLGYHLENLQYLNSLLYRIATEVQELSALVTGTPVRK